VLGLTVPALGAERLAVNVATATVRSGPGPQFDVLWQISKYHPVLALKKEADWYQIQDYEGDKGWMHQSLLAKTATVITAKPRCQVRAGPEPNAKMLTTLGPGIAFRVVEKKNGWFYVEHADGDRGWLHSSVVW